MSKYILIGIPNSGKSTIGQGAAKILQMPFYNTDNMAIEKFNLDNPAKLLSLRGIMRMFEEKQKLLAEFLELDGPAIIEVWPESVLHPSDDMVMKEIGKIIYIKRETKAAIADAMKKNCHVVMRDASTGKKTDMRPEGIKLYAKEIHHFEALADLTLDNNGSAKEGIEKLVAMIREMSTQSTMAC
jgi:shikimate kinase